MHRPGTGLFVAALRLGLLSVCFATLAACGASGPDAPASDPSAAEEGTEASPFQDVTAAVGLGFVHFNGMTGHKYMPEVIGSGGALFDYDDDGDLDLYLVQGALLGTEDYGAALFPPQPPLPPGDRLYRNDLTETGTLQFTDVTDAAGIRAPGYGMGAAAADYDNDGDVDLYVTNWGTNQLWRNDGDGTFTDVTTASGTEDPGWSISAAFLDFDRDGWLDLFVVHYDTYSLENRITCIAPSGLDDYCGPDAYPDEMDRLLRNRGDGTFEDVTLRTGLTAADGSGLGVVTADFNGDGWPDLAVANDGDENQLWINQHGQRFENRAGIAGMAVNAAGSREAGMGISAADFDNDGDEDVFMTHLNSETNTLYLNNGEALFDDVTQRSGMGLASRPYTAFGIATFDYDNDGWLDLFIANGEVRILPEQTQQGDPFPLKQPNQLFRNRGGHRFEDVSPMRDPAFAHPEVSRGVAYGDVDNDGDTDVVLFNNSGPARLLRNEVGARRGWLGLRLRDGETGRDVPGTRVALVRPDTPTLWRRVHTDGSYCSAHDPRVLFGLGDNAAYEAVRVYWPDGTTETWNGLAPHRYHTLVKGQGKPEEAS